MTRPVAVEEEIYTHEYLWRSSSVLLEKAKEDDRPSYHLLLPSLLMAFLAFEAFVNFCGFVRLPALWREEKKHFKGKGIEGKLGALVASLPGFAWEKGQRPYQTIKTLEAFRDTVAHGKVVASQYVTPQQERGLHFTFKHAWDSYISVATIEAARTDIRAFCQSLLIEMRKASDHLHLNFNAFEGSLGSASSTSVG
jgi:hypothetical protein